MSIGVDVPAARLEPALELLAEVALHPTFPEAEVERLRDERLNDLLQAEADPRRRADEVFAATIYSGGSPYRRPSGGLKPTVERLDAARLRAAYQRGLDPARATLIVGGDLTGIDVAGDRRSAARWLGRGVRRRADRLDRRRERRPRAVRPGASTGRARSRPRSGSATSACRAGSPTSTRCRSWARSSAGCSTRG